MAIYPNEAWPADSTVLSVDGGLDARTGLPFIAKGTGPTSNPSYEIQYNRRQMRENSILAGWRQGMVVNEGGLNIGVYPISLTIAGARNAFEGATGIAVPDNTTRMVYLDTAAELHLAEAWPADPADYLPLAEITSEHGSVHIEDRRMCAVFDVPSPHRWNVASFCPQVGNNQSGLKIFEYRAPQKLLLEEVQVFCTAVTSVASLDVKADGVSVLSSSVSPEAGAVVRPMVADAVIASAGVVSVHVTTNEGGSVTNVGVTLLFRPM